MQVFGIEGGAWCGRQEEKLKVGTLAGFLRLDVVLNQTDIVDAMLRAAAYIAKYTRDLRTHSPPSLSGILFHLVPPLCEPQKISPNQTSTVCPCPLNAVGKRSTGAQNIKSGSFNAGRSFPALAMINLTIELFEPGVVAAKREQSMGERSVHFVTGELTRRCQTALRSNGQPVAADAIAVAAMREKRLDLDDGELRQDITRRILWTVNPLMTRNTVVKQGWGADARWVT
jgi:hypothetical protein